MYLCFGLSSNTVTYFVVQIIPVLAIQSPFMLAPLDRPYPVFSEPFRTFWFCSMLLIHLVCSLPQLWNRPLFKEPWFFVLENGIKTKIWVSGHSFVLRAQLLRCSLVVQQVKDLHFHCSSLGCCCGAGLIPALETSSCCRLSQNQKANQKQYNYGSASGY